MTQTVKCILSRLLCSILEFHLSGNSAFSVSLRTVLLLIGLILGTIVLSSFLPFALSHIVEFGGTWLCFGGIALYLVVFLLYLVLLLPFSFCWCLPSSLVTCGLVCVALKHPPQVLVPKFPQVIVVSKDVQLFNCTYDDSLF